MSSSTHNASNSTFPYPSLISLAKGVASYVASSSSHSTSSSPSSSPSTTSLISLISSEINHVSALTPSSSSTSASSLLRFIDSCLDSFDVCYDHMSSSTGASASLPSSLTSFKPQVLFPDYPVDNSTTPWIPRVVPLSNQYPSASLPSPSYSSDYYVRELKAAEIRYRESNGLSAEEPIESSSYYLPPHPFSSTIQSYTPHSSFMSLGEWPFPSPLSDINNIRVIDQLADLEEMLEELKRERYIAIDLEHHSYRSYLGFTCLVQISSPQRDYLIDAMRLRGELFRLNLITLNGDIIKYMHDGRNDILWLQRDFGVYVIGLFDTYQASQLLGYPSLSLSFLLNRYCGVDTDKSLQRADWRQRPLSKQMRKYAVTDTHYLLYIGSCLRNECIRGNQLLEAVERSRGVSGKIYSKELSCPPLNANDFVNKRGILLSVEQYRAVELLLKWRDRKGREEDESIQSILSNNNLLTVSQKLPKNQDEFYDVIQKPIPSLLLSNMHIIINICNEARNTSDLNSPYIQAASDVRNIIDLQLNPTASSSLSVSLEENEEKDGSFVSCSFDNLDMNADLSLSVADNAADAPIATSLPSPSVRTSFFNHFDVINRKTMVESADSARLFMNQINSEIIHKIKENEVNKENLISKQLDSNLRQEKEKEISAVSTDSSFSSFPSPSSFPPPSSLSSTPPPAPSSAKSKDVVPLRAPKTPKDPSAVPKSKIEGQFEPFSYSSLPSTFSPSPSSSPSPVSSSFFSPSSEDPAYKEMAGAKKRNLSMKNSRIHKTFKTK